MASDFGFVTVSIKEIPELVELVTIAVGALEKIKNTSGEAAAIDVSSEALAQLSALGDKLDGLGSLRKADEAYEKRVRAEVARILVNRRHLTADGVKRMFDEAERAARTP